MKEFNLSEEICNPNIIRVNDIKEFIKKERNVIDRSHFQNWSLTKTFKELDKLAGDKLI